MWLAAPLALGGCDALSPTHLVDLCARSPGVSPECDRCLVLLRPADCPQCLGDSPDPDCENAPRPDGGTDGGTLTLAGDGGADAGHADAAMDGDTSDATAPEAGKDGGTDAGADASPPACGGSPGAAGKGGCAAPTPLCNTATDTCVECLKHTDCDGSTPRCDPASHACVECLAHADCDDPAAARCSSADECVPCTTSAQCAHLSGTTVCDASGGECVECTVADESPCAGKSCDPATLTCTTTPLASVGVCEACVADSECEADHRCIPMFFMGAARADAYCMRIGSTGCAKPFAAAPLSRASLSGAAAESYCGIDEATTTCEAVLGLVAGLACPGDLDCASLPGARCETVNLAPGQCTYSCGTSLACPMEAPCSSGYCGGP